MAIATTRYVRRENLSKVTFMRESSDAMVPHLQAELVYDTKTQSLASGVRAAVQRGRRILYTAEATELILQTTPEPRPDHVRLMGQVLDAGMPVDGAVVCLSGENTALRRATDDEGAFRVGGLPAGSYDLDIETATRQISVDQLDLG